MRNSANLFGLDLLAAFAYWRDGWSEALQWPAFSWLSPPQRVRVLHADGTESIRRGVSNRTITSRVAARFVALELPEDDVLRRVLHLPQLPQDEIAQAVELDVRSASPFEASDLVWGYSVARKSPNLVEVRIALTSRALVERHLAAARDRAKAGPPEVWVEGEPPIVLPGFGEARRIASSRWTRRLIFGLLALAAVLAGALVVTPTMQLRLAAIEANAKHLELVNAVKPQAQKREQLAQVAQQLRSFGGVARDRHDMLALLDELTRRLPDDVMLTRLEVTGDQVRLLGQAENAAQLLQILGAIPGFQDVRAPQGIGRSPAGGKENFTIDLTLMRGARPS